MARPLHRGGRLAESSRGHEEDDRLDSNQKGRDSILSPHSLGLWMKQTNLASSPPLLSKSSSSRISHKFSENGLKSGPKDLGPPFIDLDSSMGPANNVGRGRQGTAPTFFKCTALCFVSLFILIAVIGTAKPWTTSSRPTHNIYRGYRRLREQVMADFSDIGVISLGLSRPKELTFCSREVEDFIPCYNVSENQLRGYTNEEEYDRHCGFARIMEPCLVHPPKDYKIPLRWPTGRDVIWSGNVKITKEQLLSSGSLTKRLMLLEDSQISFRSEDALVVDGVEDYSHQIAEMIGLHNESDFIQAGVHTVLDIGCGFGSFGAHLFSKKLLTMCIATYEVYGSQVQLALERGLPAMVGSFVSRQLPYPSLSFDMVHCARCGIDWDQKDGAFLIEIDRVLKPGGYFVWTSPLTDLRGAMLTSGNQNKWKFIRDFTQKICWDLLSQQEETVVWQKTSSKDCYTYRKLGAVPPVCNKGQDIESPYYQPLLSCIAGTHSHRWIPIQNQTSWPARMTPSSDVLSIHGIQAEDFTEDSHAWTSTLKNYWSLLTPLIFSDHPKRPGEEDPLPPFNMLRNIMDMNARYGGLNAALLEARKTVWVMNVIPTSGSNTLPLILDRGFVGVLHDWCEAFPTYPRTYDMLHAAGLLSQELNHQYKCGMVDLFLEMDRILRPEGWVVLRDEIQKIEEARTITVQMRWDARVVELEGDNEQRLLVCQKPFLKK